MKEVLVLRDLECIKAIAHPRRIDVLKAFELSPLSAKQLSQLLDEPHAKVNYHIKTLHKVGLLTLVEEKIKAGIVEKYYYPVAKNIVIGKKVLNFCTNDNKNKEELCIAKFDNISELFYKAAENDMIFDENIMEYKNMLLTEDEVKELNISIKHMVEKILKNREDKNTSRKYDVSMVIIPIDEIESDENCHI